MDNEQFNNDNSTEEETPLPTTGESTYVSASSPTDNKKPKGKIITALVLFLVLVSLATVALANQKKIRNTLAMMTKSPTDYYHHIAKGKADYIYDLFLKTNNDKEDAYANKRSTSFTYDKDTVSALIQGSLGMTMEDLENQIGMSLDSFGLDTTSAKNDDKSYHQLGLQLNGRDIVSLEVLFDIAKKEIIGHLPELSSSYLRLPLDLILDVNFDFDDETQLPINELVSKEEILDFLKFYSYIFIEGIEDVKLIKNEEITVDGISTKSNRIDITITSQDIQNIALNILKEIKTDELLLKLIDEYSPSDYEYEDFIEEIDNQILEITNNYRHLDDKILEMNLYLDNTGMTLGRNVNFYEEATLVGSFGYNIVAKDKLENYQFYIKDSNGKEMLNALGSHTVEKNTYNGELVIHILIDEADLLLPDLSINLTYDDVKIDFKSKDLCQKGQFTLSSPLIPFKLFLELDLEDNIKHTNFILKMGSSDLFSLKTRKEDLADFQIPEIPETADIYEDIEEFIETVDIFKLLNKLPLDLQGLIY